MTTELLADAVKALYAVARGRDAAKRLCARKPRGPYVRLNARRADLIHKKNRPPPGLTPEEAAEYELLQWVVTLVTRVAHPGPPPIPGFRELLAELDRGGRP